MVPWRVRLVPASGPIASRVGEVALAAMTPYSCLQCMDERWVCADHPHIAWGEGKGCCEAEGAPCPNCNPHAEMPPGFVVIAERSE
jgi:hypothetical protein